MTTSLTRPLKIAIDLDGTAWKHTYFFSEFCQAMVKRGHQVGILTAHSPDFADSDYDLWKKRGFPEPSFYICNSDKEWIGNLKRKEMIKNHIDVLFDDFGGNNTAIEDTFFSTGEINTDKVLILKVIGSE